MDALPNFYNGGAAFTDPRSLSPSQSRAFYAGPKATFRKHDRLQERYINFLIVGLKDRAEHPAG
jgi:hypothetical protein